MRTCSKCKLEKMDGDFYRYGPRKLLMSQCKQCMLSYNKKWIAENKERHASLLKRWDKANPERRKAICDLYTKNNPQKRSEAAKKWRSKNKPVIAAHSARRRASILMATPAWADLKKIAEIYRNCPSGMHVDHIYPLRGKSVTGLHVPENLQYLSAEENHRKKNNLPKIIGRE